jgi:multidrug efflux pump subunit AcrA (membrane-fusion protein)
MGVETALIAASIAATAASTFMTIQANNQQAAAAAAQANADIAFLDEERKQVVKQAQADKSDRARAADLEAASIVTQLAEVGGIGTINESRFVQSVGALEGTDIARIESNSRREIASLHHQQSTGRRSAISVGKQAKTSNIAAGIGFAGSVAKIGLSAEQRRLDREAAKDGKK